MNANMDLNGGVYNEYIGIDAYDMWWYNFESCWL